MKSFDSMINGGIHMRIADKDILLQMVYLQASPL